jgi:hypothetical protein
VELGVTISTTAIQGLRLISKGPKNHVVDCLRLNLLLLHFGVRNAHALVVDIC